MKYFLTGMIVLACLLVNTHFAQGQTGRINETLRISIQEICPVSGKMLGSRGEPVRVLLGDEISFLCCRGCLGKAARHEHWKTIQTNMAAAQKVCPIMNQPVNSDMESAIVKHQRIFVCCPPCIEKVQQEPLSALTKVNANYQAFAAAKANAKSGELQAAAQKICPVSGSKLGSMGKPVKVKVGQEHVFVCCKACLSAKISLKHWNTIQDNLANAQGICPVMEEPVDGSKNFAVVNGRKIFVCCPPCVEKIETEPDHYVKVLNQLLMKSRASEN